MVWTRVVVDVVGLLARSSPKGLAGMLLLTLLAAAVPPAQIYVARDIVDATIVAHNAQAAWQREAALDGATLLVLVELLLVLSLTVADRLLATLRILVGSRLAARIGDDIMSKTLALPLNAFDNQAFHHGLIEARRESSTRPLSFVLEHLKTGRNILALGGYLGFLLNYSPLPVVILVLSALPAFVVETRYSGRVFRLHKSRVPDLRRIRHLQEVASDASFAKEVRMFGLGPLLKRRHGELQGRVLADERVLVVKSTRWAIGLSSLSVVGSYFCYGLMVWGAARREMSIGDLTMYVASFRQGLTALQSILSSLGAIHGDGLYMSNLFEFLRLEVAKPAGPPTAAARSERGIRLEGVGFRYDGALDWTLRGIDFTIRPGESVALVGSNGAGKSTLIKLITGLYQPTCGRILLDGRDMRDWDPEALRRRFTTAFQDFCRYQWTLRDNVAVGDPAEAANGARIHSALQDGGLLPLVQGLDKGLDTQLGLGYEEGVQLSGGQWQAVSLARAFMRAEADILILDEPTAALDPEAEQAFVDRLQRLSRGRTTVFVSHRLENLRRAERVLVLERGVVVEDGAQRELLARDSRYARLMAITQARRGGRDGPAAAGLDG